MNNNYIEMRVKKKQTHTHIYNILYMYINKRENRMYEKSKYNK